MKHNLLMFLEEYGGVIWAIVLVALLLAGIGTCIVRGE